MDLDEGASVKSYQHITLSYIQCPDVYVNLRCVHFLKTGEAAEIDSDKLLDSGILLQHEKVSSAIIYMVLKCSLNNLLPSHL